MDRFIKQEIEESKRVQRALAGEDISDSPRWLAKGIPSYWGALVLARRYRIQRIQEEVIPSRFPKGRVVYHALVVCQKGATTRAGAATSKDPQVAVELAFRNAVRQLIVHGE